MQIKLYNCASIISFVVANYRQQSQGTARFAALRQILEVRVQRLRNVLLQYVSAHIQLYHNCGQSSHRLDGFHMQVELVVSVFQDHVRQIEMTLM